jgi:hypothetical protein
MLLPFSCLSNCLVSLSVLQRLHAVKGLSEAKADKMVEAAKKLTTAGSWISGAEAMQKVSATAPCCGAEAMLKRMTQQCRRRDLLLLQPGPMIAACCVIWHMSRA